MFVRFLFVGSFIPWFQRDKQPILADYSYFSPVCDVSFDCVEDDLLRKGVTLSHFRYLKTICRFVVSKHLELFVFLFCLAA